MKNKIMFGMAIVAIVSVATLNVLFAGGPKNILSACSLAKTEALARSFYKGNDDDKDDDDPPKKCDAGGPGSTMCSIGQAGSDDCLVECRGAYYSCCYIDADSYRARCRCVREE